MKKLLKLGLIQVWAAWALNVFAFAPHSAMAAEDWKGKPDSDSLSVGGLIGMGIVDYSPGFGILGTVSKKIIQQGFISDINNSFWIEAMIGPVFGTSNSVWAYSTHFRWNFVKDDHWTLFAIGGVGGNVISRTNLPSLFRLTPRFGVGALYKLQEKVSLRGELSHDFIVVGALFSVL